MNNPMHRRKDCDLLRVAAMAAVVYLHTAATNLQTIANPALWHVSNVLATWATAAVPLFFMLSGALILNASRTEEPRVMLCERLPRVLVPGLFWSLLVVGGTWVLQGQQAGLDLLLRLPHTTALTPYWFLYALAPMYLLAPVLKRMVDHLEPKHWRYLLLLWAVLTLGRKSVYYLVPAPWNFFFFENFTLTVSAVGGYLGYFLLGCYLARLEKLPSRRTLWLVAVVDWLVMALGTWYFTAQTGVYSQHVLDYRGIFTAVLAVALFLLARSYAAGRESGRVLTRLAGCSMGVYLSHPFAIKAVELLLGEPTAVPTQLLSWLLALAGSVAGVLLVQRIKPLCFLLTGQRFRPLRRP